MLFNTNDKFCFSFPLKFDLTEFIYIKIYLKK